LGILFIICSQNRNL